MAELQQSNRRRFIKNIVTAIFLLTTLGVQSVFADPPKKEVKITILHTNDVHSRVEPFPMDGSRLQGLGGTARRSTLISNIRNEEKNVILLDAGDMFQGTPYFNLFGGDVELEIMSKMKYDAGTFGNHEFDNGIEGLVQNIDKANFPFVTSNYDFSNTELAGKTKDYIVLERDGIRIGIFGLGVNVAGLVDPKNYKGLIYSDPVEVANRIVPILKNKEKCDLVICLSHLGYSYKEDKISDLTLVPQTKDIDLIIGGHTHTLLDAPTEVRNADGKITLVNQVGNGGVRLGRIDYIFNPTTKEKKVTFNNTDVK